MRRLSVRRVVAASAAVALTVPLALLGATQASAVTGGPSAPATLPATASSMWQTNDAVWALAVRGGVVYAAGDFTSIRPPGAAKGTSETAMSRIAAFHADGPAAGTPCTTASPCPGIGAWTNKAVDGKVWALNISPDGKTLYAGGDFIYAGGKSHRKAAAFNLAAAGGPVLAWDPLVSGGTVRAIASTASTIYLGGSFTTVAGAARPYTAAFTAGTYTLIPGFAPALNGSVYALLAGPGGRLVLGGRFRTVNGAAHSGIAQVDLATGKVNGPMSNTIIPNVDATHFADVKALITDGTYIYLGAEGTGRGLFDGQAAVDPTTGNLVWKTNCLGATQGLALVGNNLYVGSHSHDCSSLPLGGFPQQAYANGPSSWHHLIALQARPTGTNTGGQLLTWFPTTNPGPTNAAVANELGPRAVATDGTSVFVGGQQTKVNGINQQGLTRFTPGGNGVAPVAPVASAVRVGNDVTVRFTSTSDPDDRVLSYRVLRNGTTQVYAALQQVSNWWVNQSYVFRDRGAPAGTTYTVSVADANGLTAKTTVTPTTSAGFKAAVLADKPSLYWRLNETSGTVVKDSSGKNLTGTYRGTTLNKAGAIDKDLAVGQTGVAGQSISQNAAVAAPPKTFTLEAWFRTTSKTGGRLLGWSNSATAASAHPDRTIYMSKNGQLLYGTFQTTTDTTKQCQFGSVYFVKGQCYLWGTPTYNDGGWHHVVVTQSPTAGAILYVDGKAISALPLATAPATYPGLWRVGYDNMANYELRGSTSGWNGDVDEVAVYPTVLTPAQVTAHYKAGN